MGRVEPHDVRMVSSDEFLYLRKGFLLDILLRIGDEPFVLPVPPVFTSEMAVSARMLIFPVIARRKGMFPVEGVGIIESELDSVALRRFPQFHHRIPLVLGKADIIGIGVRRVHGETVMMLRGNDEILHSGRFHHGHPFLRVEIDRVEGIDQ